MFRSWILYSLNVMTVFLSSLPVLLLCFSIQVHGFSLFRQKGRTLVTALERSFATWSSLMGGFLVQPSLSWPLPACTRSTICATAECEQDSSSLAIRIHPSSPPPPHVTLLLPAYNEELRIEDTLQNYTDYLEQSPHWNNSRCLIVVVDDGSVDDTRAVVTRFDQNKDPHIRDSVRVECFSLAENRGKGYALALGMAHVCKKFPDSLILTADADGSASIQGLEDMYDALAAFFVVRDNNNNNNNNIWQEQVLVVGYRTYLPEDASLYRLFFRWGFRTVVRLLCGDLGVRDSQCGFKLLTTSAATALYSNLHLPGWSHDVEVLYRARRSGIPVLEQAILWQDKEGSKLVASPGGVLAVCAQMFWDVIQLRWGYEMGNWKDWSERG